jgi:hypothetical protein
MHEELLLLIGDKIKAKRTRSISSQATDVVLLELKKGAARKHRLKNIGSGGVNISLNHS